jgi:GntR family transcriptional repressor for pyruvate dehydrogenase complex
MPFQRIEAEKLSHSVVRQIEQLILRGILARRTPAVGA